MATVSSIGRVRRGGRSCSRRRIQRECPGTELVPTRDLHQPQAAPVALVGGGERIERLHHLGTARAVERAHETGDRHGLAGGEQHALENGRQAVHGDGGAGVGVRTVGIHPVTTRVAGVR
jgi:hypothetical protein